MKADVSAVIVAWNAGDALSGCIESLRESAGRVQAALQVVIVDNASSDGAVESLPLEAGDVVVKNAVNAGYGVAVAQGIARSSAPWVLLANPDLVVDPWFVNSMLVAADHAAPEVATLVPELRFAARPNIVNCRGVTVDEIGVPAEVDAGTPVGTRAVETATILGGSSGCCLLRAEHVRALGGPEPMFFAYLEDVDLALRLRCAGYETLFIQEAVAFHEGSASTGFRSPLKVFLVARNRRLLFRVHGPRSPRATAWRALVDAGHAAYSTLGTPLSPWAGRLEALRLRRYTTYLRRARRRSEPCRAEFDRPPRASLLATLRRKRSVVPEED
jgi:GT2 family glycosyltransferase